MGYIMDQWRQCYLSYMVDTFFSSIHILSTSSCNENARSWSISIRSSPRTSSISSLLSHPWRSNFALLFCDLNTSFFSQIYNLSQYLNFKISQSRRKKKKKKKKGRGGGGGGGRERRLFFLNRQSSLCAYCAIKNV